MAGEEQRKAYRYDAFVSYRHTAREVAIADKLQDALHAFACPLWKLRAVRLYRDKTNLTANPDLWHTIETAIDGARHFLLIASPESAQSDWVQKELEHWLDTRGQDELIIVLTGGPLAWDHAAERFDPARSDALPAVVLDRFTSEPLWLDLSWLDDEAANATKSNSRFLDVVATISATLQGRDKDAIAGEDVRRLRVRRGLFGSLTAAAVVGFIAAGVAAINFLEQRNLAREQQRIAVQQEAEAKHQRDVLLARQLAFQGLALIETGIGDMLSRGALLAVESMLRWPSAEATAALQSALRSRRPLLWEDEAYPSGPGTFVAFSPDETRLVVSADHSKPSRILDALHGHLIKPLEPDATLVAWSPAGDVIAGATRFEVVLWSADGDRILGRVPEGFASAFALSAKGDQIATAADGRTIRIWNVPDGDAVSVLSHPVNAEYSSMESISFHPDGDLLAAAISVGDPDDAEGFRADVFSINERKHVRTLPLEGPADSVRFSPDGRLLAVGTRGTIRLLDTDTWRETMRVGEDESRSMVSVNFDRLGHYVAAVGWDAPARVWRVSDGREMARLEHERGEVGGGRVSAIVLSPGGSYAATIGDGLLRVWGLSTDGVAGKLRDGLRTMVPKRREQAYRLSSTSLDRSEPYTRALAALGGNFLSVREQQALAVFDGKGDALDIGTVADGTATLLRQHATGTLALLSPSGKWLLTTADGVSFTAIDAGSGRVSARFSHDRRVSTLLFSANEQYVATASASAGTAHIWELAENRELLRWHLKTNLRAVRISFEDDDRIFSFVGFDYDDSQSRRTGLWRPDELIAETCRTLSRNLTEAEWQRYFPPGTLPRETCLTHAGRGEGP